MIDGRVGAEFGKQMPFAQIGAQAHGGIFQLEGYQDFLFHQLPVGTSLGIGAPYHLSQQGMTDQGRIVDSFPRFCLRLHHLADRGDDLIQPIDVHAGFRGVDAGQAGAVGNQGKHRDVLPQTAGKFRDNLRHLGGQGELAQFYGAEYQYIGKGLGGGKQAEHGVFLHRPSGFGVGMTKGLVKFQFSVPADGDDTAVIKATADIIFNYGF